VRCPDPPDREMGAIEMRGGFFCGERTRAPVDDSRLTITRSIRKHEQVVCNEYRDSGDMIFEAGEMIRIFDLERAGAWKQEP